MSFLDTWKEWSKTKKIISILVICCIGIVIFAAIMGGGTPDKNTSSDNSSTDGDSTDVDDSDDELTEEEFKGNCTTLDYAQMNKNSDKYFGEKLVVTGEVVQIMEDSSGGFIRMDVNGNYGDTIAVLYEGTNDVLEGDTITVYGYGSSDYSYTSQANFEITIPCVLAEYIEK